MRRRRAGGRLAIREPIPAAAVVGAQMSPLQTARFAPFAGYEMPISYDGTLAEHRADTERVYLTGPG